MRLIVLLTLFNWVIFSTLSLAQIGNDAAPFQDKSDFTQTMPTETKISQPNDEIPKQDDICKTTYKTDKDYIQYLAEKGDAQAQYWMGAFYDMPQGHENRTFSEAAAKWFKKAADQGYIKAHGWFCDRFHQPSDSKGKFLSDLKSCNIAAEHEHRPSLGILGYLYMEGIGVPKDMRKSCFYYTLHGNKTGRGKQACNLVSPDDMESLTDEINNWQPKEPVEPRNNGDVRNEESNALFRQNTAPLNIAALLCGGTSRSCKIQSSCDKFTAIRCPGEQYPYIIANNKTKEIVSRCTLAERENCENILPKEWTCPQPRNMPPAMLAKQDTSPKPAEDCSMQLRATAEMHPLLQNVKRVNLHVVMLSTDYAEVMRCHGREEECSNKEGRILFLKNVYDAYPTPLRIDYLTELFAKGIQKSLSSVIQDGCAPFTIINNAPVGHCIDVTTPEEAVYCSRKTISDYVNDSSNLTFSLTIKIENDINHESSANRRPYSGDQDGPDMRVAILEWKAYREGCVATYLNDFSSVSTIIPLSIGAAEIEKRVNKFLNNATYYIEVFQKRKNSNYGFKCYASR